LPSGGLQSYPVFKVIDVRVKRDEPDWDEERC
jgi:hypothetical protein